VASSASDPEPSKDAGMSSPESPPRIAASGAGTDDAKPHENSIPEAADAMDKEPNGNDATMEAGDSAAATDPVAAAAPTSPDIARPWKEA